MNVSLKRVSATLLLVAVAYGVYYVVSLVWFRPADIGQFFTRYLLEYVQRQPEAGTRIRPGYDQVVGRYDGMLDNLSPAAALEALRQDSLALQTLKVYATERLDSADSVVFTACYAHLDRQVRGRAFRFHDYPLNPVNGWPGRFERLMILDHPIDTRLHSEDYVKRLKGFAAQADQLIAGMEYRYQRGIVPPRHLLEQSIADMKAFVAIPPRKNPFYTSYAQRATKANPVELGEGDVLKQMEQLVDVIDKNVYPAYQRLIAYSESLLPDAIAHEEEVGMWRLPLGGSAYAWKIEAENGFAVSPDSAWATGNRGVAYWQQQLNSLLDSALRVGQLPAGTPADPVKRLAHLRAQRVDTSAQGYERLETGLRQQLDLMTDYMKGPFPHVPATYVNIKPLAEYREPFFGPLHTESTIVIAKATGPKQTYVVWLNKARMPTLPAFRLHSLTYEQTIPGKHYLDFWGEANKNHYPAVQALFPQQAYIAGWEAWSGHLVSDILLLYTEDHLMDKAGYLYGQLERYALLTADAGLHHKRWSRKQAADWLATTLGLTPTDGMTLTDNLIAAPAVATVGALGYERMLAKEQSLKQQLGENYTLQFFHQKMIENGPYWFWEGVAQKR